MSAHGDAVAQDSHHHHGHHDHSHHEHDHQNPHLSHNERNIAHWNKVAKTYTSEANQKAFGDLINKTHAFIISNISSIGVNFNDPSTVFESETSSSSPKEDDNTASLKTIRVLDYACGPGTITNILAGYATEFIGIDISEGMISEYNERFSGTSTNDAYTPPTQQINAKAYHANLFDPAGPPDSLDDPKFRDFDLVTVGYGFHHFENLPMVTRRLVDRLAPGGVLMILDFFTHDKDDLKVGTDGSIQTIAHHGFTEETIKGLFESAGLQENLVLSFPEDVLMRGHAKRRPFLARGRKPAA